MNQSLMKKWVSFTLISMFMMLSTSIAMASGKVVLYSAHKQSIIDAMIPLFEKETGIDAEVIKAGSEISLIGPMQKREILKLM